MAKEDEIVTTKMMNEERVNREDVRQLFPYVDHKKNCDTKKDIIPSFCTCGLYDVLKVLGFEPWY